ncbi:MAG: SRPBCC family protein [Acidimicrobiia bacterium]
MQIENSFEVAAPPNTVWELLLDVEKVAPCMPGAELAEVVDDRSWKGKVTVKLGPVTMSYAGTVVIEERDDANRTVVLKASGTETRGKGVASALVTSTVHDDEGSGTKVDLVMDLTISGAAAQYGRGMIGDVARRLTGEFAACLETMLAPSEGANVHPRSPAAKAVGGLRLGLWALGRALPRLPGRLWGAITSPFRPRP